jgi:prephenate dehydrogenase
VTFVLVVGAGLIGGSIALAAREAGHEVQILEFDEKSTLEASKLLKIPTFSDNFEAEMIVVATPPNAVAQVIQEQQRLNPKATFIDVASIKTEVLVDVESKIGKIRNFVPTHPMAGKESTGAKSAAYDLFQNRVWVVTPPSYADEKSTRLAKTFIESLGAVVVEMDPEQHDSVVALTSHTPQILSSALASLTATVSEADLVVSGQGLQDMTRLASSSSELWAEILLANRMNVISASAKVREELEKLEEALNSLNVKGIKHFIDKGRSQRQRIPGKHGSKSQEYAVVALEIADEPGALGAIFKFAGEQNVNIEDIRIDHALGREIAIIELQVLPHIAESFKVALRAAGWKIRFES